MVDATLPQERCDFYVYVIFRLDGTPCYVGKGQKDRWKQHVRNSHNKGLKAIYAAAGGDLPIVKVREGLTDRDACALEMRLIVSIGRDDLDDGPLVNLTDGGEGLSGFVHNRDVVERRAALHRGSKRSPDACQRIKDALSRPEVRAKLIAYQSNKPPLSDLSKAKISATLTGRKCKPEHAAAISAATKGIPKKSPFTANHRAAISRGRTGKTFGPRSQEANAKTAAALLGRKRPPEVCAAISRGKQDISIETRQKLRAANLGKKASAVSRKRMSAAQLVRRGKSPEDAPIKRQPMTRQERSESQRVRNAGNQYGLGNKRSAAGQAIVTKSVIEANKRRNKSGKPTVHNGPTPWMDAGMSRTSWYRRRASGAPSLDASAA